MNYNFKSEKDLFIFDFMYTGSSSSLTNLLWGSENAQYIIK